MKLFALAVLSAAAAATEWGNPHGDRFTAYRYGGAQVRSPSMPRLEGPTGPRYGPAKPSPSYTKALPQKQRRNKAFWKDGYTATNGLDAQDIIGDGMGDGFGHGRGYDHDDMANLEIDMNDRDNEFDIEANMDDEDSDNDLEINMPDMDMESEIEDYGDRPKIWDGALWNRENRYGAYGRYRGGGGIYNNYGSVRNVHLNDLYPGRVQKRYDQSYTLRGYGGNVSDHDTGVLNRTYRGNQYGYGGYGGGYAANAYAKGSGPYGHQGGRLYNKEKSYDNIRSNIKASQFEGSPDDARVQHRGGVYAGYGGRGAVRGYQGYGGYGYGGYGRGYGGYGDYGNSTVTMLGGLNATSHKKEAPKAKPMKW